MVDIQGSFIVTKVKWTGGNKQYSMLFLKDRLVFVKTGGQWSDPQLVYAIPGAAIGGAVGGLVGAAVASKVSKSNFKKVKEKEKTAKGLSVETILRGDKNNFQVLYKDIKKLEVKKSNVGVNGARLGVFKVNGNGFDITIGQKYENCEKVVKKFLGNKLEK